MNTGIRWRLSVMMFLQYMVWGAWSPVFSAYLERIGFSGVQSGVIYSLLPLACMIAPFAGGQLADRYVATEKLLGILHLIGGVVLCIAATSQSYGGLLALMLSGRRLRADARLNQLDYFHHLPTRKRSSASCASSARSAGSPPVWA